MTKKITANVKDPVSRDAPVGDQWKAQMERFASLIGKKLCDDSHAYQVLPGNQIVLHDSIKLRILVCKKKASALNNVNKSFSPQSPIHRTSHAEIITPHSMWPRVINSDLI